MPRGKKLCSKGHLNAARSLSCKTCGRPFTIIKKEKKVKKKVKKTKKKIPQEKHTYSEPGPGRKQCIHCELYCWGQYSSCPGCGTAFLKAKPTIKPEKVLDFPSFGYKCCKKCKKFVGQKCRKCPNCGEAFEKEKPKTRNQIQAEKWPNKWEEESAAFRERLHLYGDTALYCLAGSTTKPKLTKRDIGEWAEDLVFNYECTRRQFVSLQALRHQLRTHFQYDELNKAFRFLTLWNKNYAE